MIKCVLQENAQPKVTWPKEWRRLATPNNLNAEPRDDLLWNHILPLLRPLDMIGATLESDIDPKPGKACPRYVLRFKERGGQPMSVQHADEIRNTVTHWYFFQKTPHWMVNIMEEEREWHIHPWGLQVY